MVNGDSVISDFFGVKVVDKETDEFMLGIPIDLLTCSNFESLCKVDSSGFWFSFFDNARFSGYAVVKFKFDDMPLLSTLEEN